MRRRRLCAAVASAAVVAGCVVGAETPVPRSRLAREVPSSEGPATTAAGVLSAESGGRVTGRSGHDASRRASHGAAPVETRSADGARSDDGVWVEGYYHFDGVRYVWQPGRWQQRGAAYLWRR